MQVYASIRLQLIIDFPGILGGQYLLIKAGNFSSTLAASEPSRSLTYVGKEVQAQLFRLTGTPVGGVNVSNEIRMSNSKWDLLVG